MDVRSRGNNLLRTHQNISVLAEEIRAILHFHPFFSAFYTLERQFRLIHRGAFSILLVINAPINEFIALGLRTREGEWGQPPPTSRHAMTEVNRIIFAMEPLLNLRNGRILLRDNLQYNLLLAEEVAYFHSLYIEDTVNVGNHIRINPHPPAQRRGATEEQIAGLPGQVATEEVTDQECCICLTSFVAGEDISVLPCSHRFHRRCIESWLRECATCPVDRSQVFSS